MCRVPFWPECNSLVSLFDEWRDCKVRKMARHAELSLAHGQFRLLSRLDIIF